MFQENTAYNTAFNTEAEAGHDSSRRHFINHAGRGLLAVGVAGALPLAAEAHAAADALAPRIIGPLDIKLPPLEAPTDPKGAEPFNPDAPDRRVGYAVVGLGHLTLNEILPAFGKCKHAKAVALVSGDADKMAKVAQQYGIKASSCYSYQTYDKLRDNPEVEVIYIVLPNSQHHEFTIRGAKAGKHILCEKPMANTAKECEEMIEACQKAGKKLMIAYRIQYEPLNRMAQKAVRDKTYGATKMIQMMNTQNQAHDQQWRHKKALAGGGSLPDVGLYCLNTTRFLLGDACHRHARPLVSAAVLRFEGQLSTFKSHLGPPHPCHRCLHPEPPPDGLVPSCSEAGVLGAVTGVMGTLQATEVLKEILGVGESMSGRLLLWDALDARFRTIRLRRDPACRLCGDEGAATAQPGSGSSPTFGQ